MEEKNREEGMLSPYRVLDLTDEKGLSCGKLLGDLGADVIKIERPGGDSARNLGPFYHDEVDPEKSLFWFAYNANKRGITLDIEKSEGQELFKRLVKGADFVIESFPPGYMDRLGLGYSALEKLNPGVIMVSITPFGQTGPYKDYAASDIILWAMSGRMYSQGDDDRPPVRMSHQAQTYLQGGLEAAAGAMLAFHHRQMTGEGQHVDQSIQAAFAQPGNQGWDLREIIAPRGMMTRTRLRITRVWPCKDGKVSWMYRGGGGRGQQLPGLGVVDRFMKPFFRWMDSVGLGDDYIKEFDWENFDMTTATQETIDRLEEPFARFFASQTKEELLEGAVKNRIIFYPTFNTADILRSPQLAARDFWEEVEHPELGTTITYPGAFVKASETPLTISRRAPLIGEHNQEVYEQELGIPMEELLKLKKAKVI